MKIRDLIYHLEQLPDDLEVFVPMTINFDFVTKDKEPYKLRFSVSPPVIRTEIEMITNGEKKEICNLVVDTAEDRLRKEKHNEKD